MEIVSWQSHHLDVSAYLLELGIDPDKFHARGPVGREGPTPQKLIVLGDGHIRE